VILYRSGLIVGFWYQLTQVVLEKRSLNRCSVVVVVVVAVAVVLVVVLVIVIATDCSDTTFFVCRWYHDLKQSFPVTWMRMAMLPAVTTAPPVHQTSVSIHQSEAQGRHVIGPRADSQMLQHCMLPLRVPLSARSAGNP